MCPQRPWTRMEIRLVVAITDDAALPSAFGRLIVP